MKNYPVVRTDKMCGTDNRIDLDSVRYMGAGGDTPTAITNGSVVKRGDLMTDKGGTYTAREVYVGGDVEADTPLSEVLLIATPEVDYDERNRDLDDFTNEAGVNARAYGLHVGSIFSVTANAFSGTPAKGDVVELAEGTQLKVVKSATPSSTTVGKIEAVEPAGKYTFYVVRVTG